MFTIVNVRSAKNFIRTTQSCKLIPITESFGQLTICVHNLVIYEWLYADGKGFIARRVDSSTAQETDSRDAPEPYLDYNITSSFMALVSGWVRRREESDK